MSWMRSVYSSNASEIGWNDQTNELLVKWARGGKTSAYAVGSEDVAEACANAPSVGQFLNMEVKPFYAHRYV